MLCGAVHFETSRDKYRWLNRVHAIFRGVVAVTAPRATAYSTTSGLKCANADFPLPAPTAKSNTRVTSRPHRFHLMNQTWPDCTSGWISDTGKVDQERDIVGVPPRELCVLAR